MVNHEMGDKNVGERLGRGDQTTTTPWRRHRPMQWQTRPASVAIGTGHPPMQQQSDTLQRPE